MSFPIKFEEMVPYFNISGDCELYEVKPPGVHPTTIIRTDQEWYIKFRWNTLGPLNCLMCGNWEVQVYLEQMGKGEFALPNSVMTEPFVSKPFNYDCEIRFQPGKVPEGVYRIVATIKLLGPTGIPGPVVGFAEGPLVQFYHSKNLPTGNGNNSDE
ncbi:MAG: hypothetical protein D6748_13675 [Calditrichaeota bacterium]|nr:MAG: hypothetical protein D6748_13675 [Calditrichota bacterium]